MMLNTLNIFIKISLKQFLLSTIEVGEMMSRFRSTIKRKLIEFQQTGAK